MPGRSIIRPCYASLLLLLLLLVPGHVTARSARIPQSSSNSDKNDYALIYGTIWGPDDHPVPGVPVKIRRAQDKKAKWELVSNSRGEFAQRVPAGREDYVVEADIKMPKGQPKPQTQAHIDNDERQDISIHLTKEELPRH